MIAYKGFNKDLACTMGSGVFRYRIGETVREERAKCGREGLHCCEYVLDCMSYYSFGGGNRFCQVEALGSINEDGGARISCTKMRVVRELTKRQIAAAAMAYMVAHPLRDWERMGALLCVKRDRAACDETGGIAIARGADPVARGAVGTVIALLQETEPGVFSGFCVAVAGEEGILPGKWYRMNRDGMMEVAE